MVSSPRGRFDEWTDGWTDGWMDGKRPVDARGCSPFELRRKWRTTITWKGHYVIVITVGGPLKGGQGNDWNGIAGETSV